jgi:diacylglycerol kinase (ATP)
MWALVINPVSGQGKGAQMGTHVAGYLNSHGVSYEIIIGRNEIDQTELLQRFLDRFPDCSGVIAVGGDGLFHLVLQKITPAQVPLALIPAGTGNDFVRTLGWSLDDVDAILESILSKKPRSVDLGLVDGEWFGAILSSGFDSVVNEKANTMSWPKALRCAWKSPRKQRIASKKDAAPWQVAQAAVCAVQTAWARFA